ALALVLLAGAALMIQTFAALRRANPGFDAHNVLTMQTAMGGTRYSKTAQVETLTRQVLQKMEALPGVQAAASTIVLPMEGGVDGNVRETGIRDGAEPVMYVPVVQIPDGLTKLAGEVIPTSWVIRTAGDPLTLSNSIQQQFLAVDSQLPVSHIRTMEQVISQSVARQNFNMLLLTIFAGIALLLAAIGIYGLMSYSVAQRSHEIGIRMALGSREN